MFFWDKSASLVIIGMMLMIQGGVNDNYLSLSERLSVPSGYTILTRFISEDTLVDTTVLPVTTSGTHAYRYHKLTITEKVAATDSERRAGNVTLDPYGTMLYEVYQTTATVQGCDYNTGPIRSGPFPLTEVTFTKNDEEIFIGTIADLAAFDAMFISYGWIVGALFYSILGSTDEWNGITFINADDEPIESPFVEGNCQAIGISLDYLLADKLLETGKCLVTKSSGFDNVTEYTGT